ncbi:MAG: recombinase family protein, partial [Rhodomicrobiaceae bacterium]
MNALLKVQPHHLERGAYLYIRQSSMRQVVENAESARRQYALRGRAVALGWRDEQI